MRTVTLQAGVQGASGAPWQGVQYFCTWRGGGASRAPWDSLNLGLHVQDDPQAVAANRQRLRLSLPDAPLWLEQVHGTRVQEAQDPASWQSGAPCADAAVTTLRAHPLAIMTADCLPVVLADATGTVLGVAHAGWRGLAAGVLESTLEAMRRRRPGVGVWRAWLGPAIGLSAFEVGDEVRDAFVAWGAEAAACFERWPGTGRWHADLAALARQRLARAGVAQIEASGECTWTQAERYFSYRRDGRTGRQATIAWLA